ncbi:MAG: ABC transporter ATP-binding protein [Ruminococcaceae bacterium]|nr:ABC transporter ATP-binding protein [Oscillospiraceae bacterium]
MELLRLEGLTKRYDGFTLDNVSFALEEGYIMGFIGRNGAGKTTTLKTMLGLVHPDGGTVQMCGMDFQKNERACRQQIGVVFGEFDHYPKKKLSAITDVYRRFYEQWDDAEYRRCLERFELDESKTVEQLSSGMRVKYSLALALSHGARLLILDEPTSGLDPISRDELMELFQSIIEDGTRSILFSTHITSDLEKCADYITYLKDGRIVCSMEHGALLESWRMVKGGGKPDADIAKLLVGCRTNKFGFDALVRSDDAEAAAAAGLEVSPANLEDIMLHLEKD